MTQNLAKYRYATADVFTDRLFHGNPVAVVLDAEGLSSLQMQAIAREFNYIETTFVKPPESPSHTAQVRIFTPAREVPFAGHPNIGTAFILARDSMIRGQEPLREVVFEEAAGLVPIDLLWRDGLPIGAELTCPEPFSRRAQISATHAAACLSLDSTEISTAAHPPQVVSVGLPFLVVELASRDALRRARPNKAAYEQILPLDGAHSIYAYTSCVDAEETACDLLARMFTAFLAEDPATGSATAAVSALLTEIRDLPRLKLRVRQGVDMGRPSTLVTTVQRNDTSMVVKLGGHCVVAMEGTLLLPL